ncbi:MAG: hypothetical protein KGM39_06690, partial [Actinomycetales bacterium]|nr:hypothetical protein [Actinomycetales bacterium]
MKLQKVAAFFAIIALSSSFNSSEAKVRKPTPQKEIVINVVGDVHGESAIKRDALVSLKKYFA